jgi:activator of HSP90 ATPase
MEPFVRNQSVITVSLGEDANGVKATGQIHIPEVAHDTDPDDYVVCCLIPNSMTQTV